MSPANPPSSVTDLLAEKRAKSGALGPSNSGGELYIDGDIDIMISNL